MMRKDDTAFKEMEQAKALAEQEAIRAKEEASALRKKKMEEREAARREEYLKKKGGSAAASAHGLRGAAAALPAWLLDKGLDPKAGDALDPQGFVFKCKYPQLGDMAYYMDRRRRYPFCKYTSNLASLVIPTSFLASSVGGSWLCKQYMIAFFSDRLLVVADTDEEIGGAGLMNLMSRNEVLLGKNMERLQNLAQGDQVKLAELLAGGKHVYDTKPTLSATRGTDQLATWSQEEYGQPGLQREYLVYKSLQRFTETWALLERASDAGLFALEVSPLLNCRTSDRFGQSSSAP